jgi:glycine betaine/proline transport system ATP-binding protein
MSEAQTKKNVKLQIRDVYKIFGGRPQKARKLLEEGKDKDSILSETGQAIGVGGVSFDVYTGETLVVMGLSGSGKSTLIRCVNRLHEPTFGSILLDGKDITKMGKDELRETRRKKFGMVFQSFALFPHKTVLENVEFGLEIQEIDEELRAEKAKTALEQVGLSGWEQYYPDNLSGGMKQRVGLARALASDPDILLMDEAFSALDPLIREDMQDELLSLESTVQKTILFITHDLDEALKMGDRIVLMKDGKVVQIGTPEDIIANPADEYVAKFVKNVDRTKVLTAGDVMLKPRHLSYVKDGPHVALKTMRDFGLSGLFIVKQSQELIGWLSIDAAITAAKTPEVWLDHVMERNNFLAVTPNTPVKELFGPLSDKDYPIPVITPEYLLRGMVYKGSVLAALAQSEEV